MTSFHLPINSIRGQILNFPNTFLSGTGYLASVLVRLVSSPTNVSIVVVVIFLKVPGWCCSTASPEQGPDGGLAAL